MRARFRGLIPGANWVPSDLPSQDQGATKKKPHRSLFSLKASSDPQHGELKQRKSTISLKSEPDPEVDARTRPQAQSRFFALLPLEIRRMVYEYVMGEENIHLTFSQKKKFGHFICDGQHVEGRECACRVLVGGRKSDRLDGGGARMLRSCRRMYSEAVPYLYRPHTFSLLHITHLLYLPSSLPQPRLNTIRRLQLRWAMRALPYLRRGSKLAYKEDTSNWEKAWRIMAAMEGLRELCVVLIDPSPQSMWERNWLELEPRLLEPVKAVSQPQCFDLVLPYASCSTAWEMGDSNVMLRRPEGAEGSDDEDQI